MKRNIATLLIVFMCIESFGVAVSDNDGAAFISKAEYDSKKNEFQRQLESITSSIDPKITDAINSYISDTTNKSSSVKSILFSSKDDYIITNREFNNEYQFPDMNISISLTKLQFNDYQKYNEEQKALVDALWLPHPEYLGFGVPSDDPNLNSTSYNNSIKTQKNFWLFAAGNYTRTSKSNVRNVVTDPKLNNYTYSSSDPIVLYGQAQNKRESWNLLGILDFSSCPIAGSERFGGDPGYLYETHTNEFYLGNCLRLVVSGRLPDFTNTTNRIWQPTVSWRYGQTGVAYIRWGLTNANFIAINNSPSVKYEVGTGSETWKYKNLGTWTNSRTIECELYNNQYYANYSTINTKTTEDWLNACTPSDLMGKWTGMEYHVHIRSTPSTYDYPDFTGYKMFQNARWVDGADPRYTGRFSIPQLGLIPSIKTSADIYQYYDTLYDINGNKVPNLKLNQGFPLCPVMSGEKITWEPKFSKISSPC